ncbi:MAG: sigma-70 family RNA polymerase sigma factor [Betaproteobacteria bacterium]|nr:sigma-70 family RNA polymerase sigma factor [Betaproteobacteria bacterium]MCC6247337.1 sigma-70 family RNA polymerase sigma factor [Rubrivivax sp.]
MPSAPVERPGEAAARTEARQDTRPEARLEAIWRIESAKIIGALARVVRDVGLAEDLAQEALVAALEHWPRLAAEGALPDNPGAWLMTTAKNRALDWLRQRALHERKQQELGADADARGDHVVPDFTDRLDDAREDYGDDLLRLIFAACHPVLPREAQLALTLRLLGGLTTAEIARAFVVPEPTIAQRIVRAKRTLAEAKVPFEVPRGEALATRLAVVLEVIYLVFNEGYSATAGDDWMRPALCEEALRLGRVLAALAPGEAEVHGLVALMEIQASRLRARTDAEGRPIVLLDQDRGRWDRLLIGRGLAALARARALAGDDPRAGSAGDGDAGGPYTLQAAIAACHAVARTAAETDWARIVALYDRLLARVPTPVVELNRAVALSMAQGPAAALPLVEALTKHAQMQRYHLLHAVHGDLLARLGRAAQARKAFKRAAALTGNERERALLSERAHAAG